LRKYFNPWILVQPLSDAEDEVHELEFSLGPFLLLIHEEQQNEVLKREVHVVLDLQLVTQHDLLDVDSEDDLVEVFDLHDLAVHVVALELSQEVDALVGQTPPVLLQLVEILEQHQVLVLHEESGVAFVHHIEVIEEFIGIHLDFFVGLIALG